MLAYNLYVSVQYRVNEMPHCKIKLISKFICYYRKKTTRDSCKYCLIICVSNISISRNKEVYLLFNDIVEVTWEFIAEAIRKFK